MARATRTATTFRDILTQAVFALAGRRTRSALTAAGIALGITAAVATLGITASAANAVSGRFDALTATQVTLKFPSDLRPGAEPLPEAALTERVLRLNGVLSAGLSATASNTPTLTRLPSTPSDLPEASVVAAQPGALRALGITEVRGRMFDDGHEARAERVALLDTVAAATLAPGGMISGLSVFVAGTPYTVIGIFTAPDRAVGLTSAVVLPYWTARGAESSVVFSPAELVIRTRLGAADQVGREAPLAVAPNGPGDVAVLVPADPRTLRQGIEADTRALFLGLAAVSLVIGALGVSNVAYVAVLERRSEIGLRRAVGASRAAVAAQFCLETSILGVVGGVVGTVMGIQATAATCLTKDWLIIVDPSVVAAGPSVGWVVGLVAGLYPAVAAARVQPADTLRS